MLTSSHPHPHAPPSSNLLSVPDVPIPDVTHRESHRAGEFLSNIAALQAKWRGQGSP